jgi:hypothetical protein
MNELQKRLVSGAKFLPRKSNHTIKFVGTSQDICQDVPVPTAQPGKGLGLLQLPPLRHELFFGLLAPGDVVRDASKAVDASRGEDTKRNLKHVKDRAANLTDTR